MESLNSDPYSDRDITVSCEEITDSTSGQAEGTKDSKEPVRELRNPLSVLQKNQHYEGHRTPPYLSPGVTRKVKLNKDKFDFETDL